MYRMQLQLIVKLSLSICRFVFNHQNNLCVATFCRIFPSKLRKYDYLDVTFISLITIHFLKWNESVSFLLVCLFVRLFIELCTERCAKIIIFNAHLIHLKRPSMSRHSDEHFTQYSHSYFFRSGRRFYFGHMRCSR